MRKRLIDQEQTGDAGGLDLERIASIELTSEDPAHPIEEALRLDGAGWRAATPGAQVIRVIFDQPATLRMIELRFEEGDTLRTQEFSLQWSADIGSARREIVRQQYTFSPPTTSSERERYAVDLDHVAVLELHLTPDIAGGHARASLKWLRVA